MRLTINGEMREFAAPLSVAALLAALDVPPTKVAVERNREIVRKSTYTTQTLSEGDCIEIVHFIGGG